MLTLSPRALAALCMLLFTSLAASVAPAATIFDNFGPGDSYDINDSDVTGPAKLAYRFSVAPGNDYDLDQVILPLDSETAPTSASLTLAADSGGSPGAVLTSFPTISVLNPIPGDIFTVSPDSATTLTGGSDYWLILSPLFGVEVGWGINNSGAIVPGAFTLDGTPPWGAFSSQVAFRVEGTIVSIPEPSVGSLLSIGLIALGVSRRRQ